MSTPAMMAAKPAAQRLKGWIQKTLFYMNGYHKYGLMSNDLLYITPEVREALKRIPKKEYDERYYRMARAINVIIIQFFRFFLTAHAFLDLFARKSSSQRRLDQVRRRSQVFATLHRYD